MRCQIEIEVDLPRERLIELFLDRDNLKKWQTGFVSLEPISGATGEVGAKTRQVHKSGSREQEIVETITVMNPPEEICGTYEGGSVRTLIENRFYEVAGGKTRWVLVSDFQSTNIILKLLAFLAPGMFKKQTRLFMDRFKEFAESSG